MFFISKDLRNHILANFTNEEIGQLNESQFLISGGGGFAAEWIVTTLFNIFEEVQLPKVTLISRKPAKTEFKFRQYANLSVIDWNTLTTNYFPRDQRNFITVHSSVPAASGKSILPHELDYYSFNTYALLTTTLEIKDTPTFVNLSSGGLYKRPSSGRIKGDEDELKMIDLTPYEKVKCRDEEIVQKFSTRCLIKAANPRLFSFTGPGLEVPGRFALTEFVHNAMTGKRIEIQGNPNSLRSYMSPIDMGIWVLKCCINPSIKVMHIGAAEAYSMRDIANIVALKFSQSCQVMETNSKAPLESYVPENEDTMKSLNIKKYLSFRDSLDFWAQNIF